MKTSRLTDDQLRAVLPHLKYEIAMFQYTAIFRGPTSEINNAILESFAIHARALIEFVFTTSPQHRDYVLARDFFTKPSRWDELREAKPRPDLLKKVQGRASAEIVHLSYGRLSVHDEARNWDRMEIFNELRPYLQLFVKHADRVDMREIFSPHVLGTDPHP